MYRTSGPCRPVGSIYPSPPASRRSASAAGQASELSADGVLQHLFVLRQIRDQLPQFYALVLELLQAAHVGQQQAVAALLPVEITCLSDPCLAADLHHRHSVGALLQDERLLRVRTEGPRSENFDAFIVFHSARPRAGYAENSRVKRSNLVASHQGSSPRPSPEMGRRGHLTNTVASDVFLWR